MGGGAGRGLNFGATYGSGQPPLGHQTQLPPKHHEAFPRCTTKLNENAQGKHIPGHKNYQKGGELSEHIDGACSTPCR